MLAAFFGLLLQPLQRERFAMQGRFGVLSSTMPVHDWNRVTAGTFHAFHLAWIAETQRTLNGGLLPQGYHALAEQVAGEIIPDVLTLQQAGSAPDTAALKEGFGSGAGAA